MEFLDAGSIPAASKNYLSGRLHSGMVLEEVPMRQDDIDLTCEVCGSKFSRRAAEVKRSRKLNRRFFCSRKCAAVFKNKMPESRERSAKIGRSQTGSKNHNWKGGISNSESVLKSRSKYPERWGARRKLQQAVKIGSVIKPDRCEHCNRKRYLSAPHEDYDQPLQVSWLCRECHGKADRDLRRQGKL